MRQYEQESWRTYYKTSIIKAMGTNREGTNRVQIDRQMQQTVECRKRPTHICAIDL